MTLLNDFRSGEPIDPDNGYAMRYVHKPFDPVVTIDHATVQRLLQLKGQECDEVTKKLREDNAKLRHEVRVMQLSAEMRNKQLEAMHWVWSIGCFHGGRVKPSQEIIDLAINNTRRLAHHGNDAEFLKFIDTLPSRETAQSYRHIYHANVQRIKHLEAQLAEKEQ